jgi:hypothetical protein
MPDDAIQDLVEELIEFMDDSQFSLHEQFQALHRVTASLHSPAYPHVRGTGRQVIVNQ